MSQGNVILTDEEKISMLIDEAMGFGSGNCTTIKGKNEFGHCESCMDGHLKGGLVCLDGKEMTGGV